MTTGNLVGNSKNNFRIYMFPRPDVTALETNDSKRLKQLPKGFQKETIKLKAQNEASRIHAVCTNQLL